MLFYKTFGAAKRVFKFYARFGTCYSAQANTFNAASFRKYFLSITSFASFKFNILSYFVLQRTSY